MGEAWRKVIASGAVDAPSPRCSDDPPEGLVQGVRLFNSGKYYECHEVLEDIWHAERESIRYLYQGILQIGVGFHHWRNGNFRGATLLLRDGIDKVSRFVPICMTVETERLCSDADRCLAELIDFGPERLNEFDWAKAPRIQVCGGEP